MNKTRNGDVRGGSDQQRSREDSFVQKTRDAIVRIVTERLEKPEMFKVRLN